MPEITSSSHPYKQDAAFASLSGDQHGSEPEGARHLLLDCCRVDTIAGVRPYLTVVMDQATRAVISTRLTDKLPDTKTALEAIGGVLQPEPRLDELSVECDFSWSADLIDGLCEMEAATSIVLHRPAPATRRWSERLLASTAKALASR